MGFDTCIMPFIHHYSMIQNNFPTLKMFYVLPVHLSTHPLKPQATSDLSIFSVVLLFSIYHIMGIIQYVAFSDWLLLLNSKQFNFLFLIYGLIAHFFLPQNNISLKKCTKICFSIHLLKGILIASNLWQL